MAWYEKITGIIGTTFQLGLTGPKIKDNSGVIEMRNAADGAYAVVRGADPVADTDLVTKLYCDGFTNGEVNLFRFAIDNTASQASTTTCPINLRCIEARVIVETPYSAGATITVGTSGTPTLFIATTDVNLEAAGTYVVPQDALVDVASTIRVAIAGSPAAGAGVVEIICASVLP